jgi:hypothetical protein
MCNGELNFVGNKDPGDDETWEDPYYADYSSDEYEGYEATEFDEDVRGINKRFGLSSANPKFIRKPDKRR